jgi:60 kDa SS-A/Ro ribonucleoprotein
MSYLKPYRTHGVPQNSFSIADPNDPGMLDVVGFDTATPQLVSDFARGAL